MSYFQTPFPRWKGSAYIVKPRARAPIEVVLHRGVSLEMKGPTVQMPQGSDDETIAQSKRPCILESYTVADTKV